MKAGGRARVGAAAEIGGDIHRPADDRAGRELGLIVGAPPVGGGVEGGGGFVDKGAGSAIEAAIGKAVVAEAEGAGVNASFEANAMDGRCGGGAIAEGVAADGGATAAGQRLEGVAPE